MYYGNNMAGGNNYGFNNNGVQTRPMENIILNQPLTKEEVNKLRAGGKTSTFDITEDECLVQMCSHKDPESGSITLVDNGNNTCTCSICGETFSPVTDLSDEEVENICADFNDVLQTSKLGSSVPNQVGRSLFRTFAFIKHVPNFYRISMNYFKKWESMGNRMTEQNRSVGAFQNLMMITNPVGMGMGGYGNPMMQQQMPMGTPMGYGAPQAAPQQMGGYGMPNQGYGMAMNTPNPGVDSGRPIGVVEPQAQPAGPAPMAGTADVNKPFKS